MQEKTEKSNGGGGCDRMLGDGEVDDGPGRVDCGATDARMASCTRWSSVRERKVS